jgi:hypothetical protein
MGALVDLALIHLDMLEDSYKAMIEVQDLS